MTAVRPDKEKKKQQSARAHAEPTYYDVVGYQPPWQARNYSVHGWITYYYRYSASDYYVDVHTAVDCMCVEVVCSVALLLPLSAGRAPIIV